MLVSGGAAVLVAALNWWSRWRGNSRVELVTKPLTTMLIALFAMACAFDGNAHASTTSVVAAVVGFVCCLAGDVALLPIVDKFVVGLSSFLVGHLAFVVMSISLGLDRWWLGAIALVGTIIVAVRLGRRIIAGAVSTSPEYAMPVRAYLVVISSMAVIGWATGRPAALFGSTAFIVSDSVLGWEVFVEQRPWMPVAIMVTYHAALFGLAASLW